MPIRFHTALCLSVFILTTSFVSGIARAADTETIKQADVTKTLGPDFFVDDAAIGGQDMQAKQPDKLLKKIDFASKQPLKIGDAGTQITITGVGFAMPNPRNLTAETVQITVRYFGSDGKPGGKDDVVIGTVNAKLIKGEAGEYACKFSTPLTAVVDGKGSLFRLELAPINSKGDATLRLKAIKGTGIKVSVAGTSKAIDK